MPLVQTPTDWEGATDGTSQKTCRVQVVKNASGRKHGQHGQVFSRVFPFTIHFLPVAFVVL